MLYIIIDDEFAFAEGVQIIETHLRKEFPQFEIDWYWHDTDTVEYGVKVKVETNDPDWLRLMTEVVRYCLVRGGRIILETE